MSNANSEKTIEQMTAEIRATNIAKGWRPAEGGPGTNSFGDYIALLHSELSEALEAYRDHRLEDATAVEDCEGPACDIHGHEPVKPEGVGSEFADVLIRLLDTVDVFGVHFGDDMDLVLAEVSPVEGRHLRSFGDWMAWLHGQVAQLGKTGVASLAPDAAYLMRALVGTAKHFGIDLTAEYERKITYNRTRPYQHGGRTLADR